MYVASASSTVKFHEFPSGTVVHNYQPGTNISGPIRCISWSRDGNWLALVPNSGPAEIVSVKDQLKLLHTIESVDRPQCAAFAKTTKRNVALGTSDGSILIYDIKARNVKKQYPKSPSAITHIDFTMKDNHLVAANQGTAHIYSNVSKNLVGTMRVPRSEMISALRTSPIKRNYVAAGSGEGVVAVWDINTNKNKFFVGSHKAPVSALTFSPINCNILVSTGLDRQFCLYDIAENKCVHSIFVENNMSAVDFSPDGKFIVMASQNGDIHVYDIKKLQQPMHKFAAHNSAIKHLSFRKSEKDYDGLDDMSTFDIASKNGTASCDSKLNEIAITTTASNDTFNLNSNFSHSINGLSPNSQNDSFFMALGLHTDESRGGGDGEGISGQAMVTPIKEPKMAKSTTMGTLAAIAGSNNDKPAMFNKTQEVLKMEFTSTPNNNVTAASLVSNEVVQKTPLSSALTKDRTATPSPYRPILLPSPITASSATSSLASEKRVKEIVQSELRALADELKSDIKYRTTEMMSDVRMIVLDVIMQNVKESIKIENHLNSMRCEFMQAINGGGHQLNDDCLSKENVMLRQRIAELEEELETVRNNNKNGLV